MKLFIIAFIIGFVSFGAFLFGTYQEACGTYQSCNDKEVEITPTIVQDVTPTPVEEVTPTPVEEVTPTPEERKPKVTPTPTEIPKREDTHVAGSSAQTSTSAPTPACTIAFNAPILQGYTRVNPSTVEFRWWKSTDTGITKQSIVYGYEEGKPLFGADNLANEQTSIVLNGLAPNKVVWAQVTAWRDWCPAHSNWLDP